MGINTGSTSPTVGTTPYGVMSQSTSITYQTTDAIVQLFIDINAIAAGDEFKVKGLEKIDGTNARTFYEANIAPQTNKGWVSPMFIMTNGWEFTIEKVTGTDRSLPFSIRYVT